MSFFFFFLHIFFLSVERVRFCPSLSIVVMSKVQSMPFLKVSDLTHWLGMARESSAFEKTFRLTGQNVAQLLSFLNVVEWKSATFPPVCARRSHTLFFA